MSSFVRDWIMFALVCVVRDNGGAEIVKVISLDLIVDSVRLNARTVVIRSLNRLIHNYHYMTSFLCIVQSR